MKKISGIFAILFFSIAIFGQSNQPKNEFTLISSDNTQTTLRFDIGNYNLTNIYLPNGINQKINAPNGVPFMVKSSPEVYKYSTSIMIPDQGDLSIEILDSKYQDFKNISLIPSKGNLMRTQNPESIPYTFGSSYLKNRFYPNFLANFNTPYILRDYRGQTINIYPFQYNPVSKTLRVYSEITIKLTSKENTEAINTISTRNSNLKTPKEYQEIYKSHFLNYETKTSTKYTPLDEHGKMLIISKAEYMPAMQEFVNWKNMIGIPTEMVSIDSIGNTQTAIKNYVTGYYNNKGLTFLLFVGDAQHITPATYSGNPSDNYYGYISGNDSYSEIFVGRFSAESIAHVQTQVKRSIQYELNPTIGQWLNTGIGIGSDEGPGYQNLYDYQHMRLIRDTLLGYEYTNVSEIYDGSQGGLDAAGNATAAQVSTAINNGAGIINYIGHGSETEFVTSGFNNSNVNNLTNVGKLPFIWSVACVNGSFVGKTCFAEAWMRASSNGEPTGAVATLMSTINQSWNPPMAGQREMNDILTESFQNNIKRTFGGLSMNGCMKMIDLFGTDGSQMTDTWTIFGDPSLVVRTKSPLSMTVTHEPQILMQETSLAINCDVNGAFVTLSINNHIIGTGTIASQVTNISFDELATTDSITVVVTKYNYLPYIGKVAVIDILYNNDAEILSILNPASSYNCVGYDITPKVILRNKGINPLTSVTIRYTLNDGSNIDHNWIGNLASFAKDTVELTEFPLSIGNNIMNVTVLNPNNQADGNTDNDSKIKSFSVQVLPLSVDFTANATQTCVFPSTIQFINSSENGLTYLWNFGDGTTSTELNPNHTYQTAGFFNVSLVASAGICGNQEVVKNEYIKIGLQPINIINVHAQACAPASTSFSVVGMGNTKWYSDSACTQLVNTGNTFTTPDLSLPTRYFVREEAVSPSQYIGKVDSIGSGSYYTSSTNVHYLIFNCYSPTSLVSVKVYSGGSGNRTIQLRDASANVIATKTVNIPAGSSRVTLNFNIPVGTGFQLACIGSPNLYRNNNQTATYPYTINGLISITESSASLPQYNAPGNYYYFYDWEVREPNCYSPTEVMIADILPVPVPNFISQVNGATVQFNNSSLYANSYEWKFGDGNTSSEINPIHDFNATETFMTKLIANGLCGTDSITQNITTSILAPIADFSANNTTINSSNSVIFTDNSLYLPTSWLWNFEGGTPATSNAQNPTVFYFTPGVYDVSLTAQNSFGHNSMNKTEYIVVNDPTAINENALIHNVFIHPNPTNGINIMLNFNLNHTSTLTIKVYDEIGNVVQIISNKTNFYTGENSQIINLEGLSNGFYYIGIEGDGIVMNKKLILIK